MNKPKPTPSVLRKAAKAPQAYRPQPTPKCLQLKASRGPAANPAQAKKQGPVAPAAYRPQPVPKVLQRKTASVQLSAAPSRASRVVQRMEVRQSGMVWSEFVIITMPSNKHILEKMKLSDANGNMKISVVEQAVAEEAVEAIGKHVKTHGWNSADDITIVKADDGVCWEITYKGNHWMTHSNSGQLWPLRGTDIFSPPNDGTDMRPHIRKWKGNKQNRPQVYMNQ